jgi:hypothetical protein
MKAIHALPFLTALFFIGSCASTEKMLTKTWKIDEVVFMDSVSAYNAEQKAEIVKQLTHNISFSFSADSNYAMSSGSEKTNTKWWLSNDKKAFFTISPQEKVIESEILKLNKKSLEFITHEKGDNSYKFVCSLVKASK